MSEKESPIKKAIKGFLPYFATPAMLVFLIYNYASDKQANKNLQFNTVTDKVNTKDHIDNSPNDVDTYIAFQKIDSITKATLEDKDDAIRSRADRDSIVKKNSITIYQLKQGSVEQNKISNEILRKLDSIIN